MELVIKLSKKNYEHIKRLGALWIESEQGLPIVSKALLNGTPLPKGHGDLKDFRKIYADMTEKEELARQRVIDTPTNSPVYMRYIAQLNERTNFKEMLFDAPTIIEADKEYEVEIVTRGNCMMCGKELDEGLFFCKECEAKIESGEKNDKG